MRRTLTLIGLAVLALAIIPAALAPSVSQAAGLTDRGLTSNWRGGSFTGTIVATPQTTLPAILLLQVGGSTVAVAVTTATQLEDAAGAPLSITALVDGDTVQVTGTRNRTTQVDASVLQDLSQGSVTAPSAYQATGNLAATPGGVLCLQNASVAIPGITANAQISSPCPSGDLPVYLTGSTSFENATGAPIASSAPALGDLLSTTGTLTNGQFTASLVQDMTQSTTTSSSSLQATGTLAAAYADVLCLQNASITSGAVTPYAQVSSPCPNGDLPVYYTSSTSFTNATGAPSASSALALNDTLSATGTLTNGQFEASLVQDLAQSAVSTTSYQLKGVLASAYAGVLCLQNVSAGNGVLLPTPLQTSGCPNGTLAVTYTGSTSFENNGGQPTASNALQINDVLAVTGTLTNSQFTASLVQDLSQVTTSYTTGATTSQTSPMTLVGTVQSFNFSGRNRSVTIRIQQGSWRGTYTISLPTSAQILSHTGGKIKLTSIRKGQSLSVTGVFNTHSRRWTSVSRVQMQ